MKSAFVSISTRLTLTWAASISGGLTLTPAINKIIEVLSNKLFVYLAEQSELGVFFLYIDTRVGEQSRDFEAAAYNNWKARQSGTEEERLNAEKKLWYAFKAFAVLTN
jgi:hypothetical protein